MDSLIDFNSPKLRREDLPLIPGNSLRSMSNSFSVSGEESNPFDMVVCQVAANAAAENDPFEMVLHDAINSQVVNKMDLNVAVENSCVYPKLDKERVRKSISLPDLRPVVNGTNPKAQETEKIGIVCGDPEQCFRDTFHAVSQNDYFRNDTVDINDSADWNYLDDIPPPDSLLNATVDMSCFLDDTLPANNSSKPIVKHPVSSGHPENQPNFADSLGLEQPSKANVKSEEEIVLLAQKKIENIISKATLEVQNDIQDSIIQRRLSSQLLTPYKEALGLFTPKRSKETRSRLSIEPSLSVQEWSRNEIMKLNIVLPEPPKKSLVGKALESDIDKICNSFLNDEANISSEEMPTGDLSFSSPMKQVTRPQEKEGKSLPSGSESQMKTPDLSSSPSLLPLPLCEDAVRNLSLCSKYSPSKGSTHQNKSSSGVTQSALSSSNLEQTGKQTKFFLRKPVVPSRTSSKMAPMKATAPIHNMTRTKSSLTTSAKLDINNAVTSAARKSVSKMPQSPKCALSGSLPNLSTHGSKAPSRLPSPRRSVAPVQEPLNMMMKRQTEKRREKSTQQIAASTAPLHSSPRPIRKGSLYNKSGRVLADVNTSSIRMSPKYKNNHADSPRRGTSFVTEKENFL